MKKLFSCLVLMKCCYCMAQEPITLKEAELLLQKNNLILLAEEYNIPAAKASVIQARIWDLPFLTAEINAFSSQDKELFKVGKNGQKAMALQQLIYLGGKKRNEVSVAKSNLELAELQFEQLLRNLKYQLTQTFYKLYYDNQKVNNVDNQIEKLQILFKNYETQSIKGNVPLKEVVRLNSLILNLINEKNNLLKMILDEQQTLSLLIGVNNPRTLVVEEQNLLEKYQKTTIPKEQIAAVALEYNLDYLSSLKIIENQELQLKWQKSLATPDVTVGASYDQSGGAFRDQVNLTIGIPLPLWNKNKGNIKLADLHLKQTTLNKDFKKLELQSQVEKSWQTWLQQKNQLDAINNSISKNIELVYQGMVSNFEKRNISLLEFTDFMESYNTTILQINEIKKALILAGADINYITNKEIF